MRSQATQGHAQGGQRAGQACPASSQVPASHAKTCKAKTCKAQAASSRRVRAPSRTEQLLALSRGVSSSERREEKWEITVPGATVALRASLLDHHAALHNVEDLTPAERQWVLDTPCPEAMVAVHVKDVGGSTRTAQVAAEAARQRAPRGPSRLARWVHVVTGEALELQVPLSTFEKQGGSVWVKWQQRLWRAAFSLASVGDVVLPPGCTIGADGALSWNDLEEEEAALAKLPFCCPQKCKTQLLGLGTTDRLKAELSKRKAEDAEDQPPTKKSRRKEARAGEPRKKEPRKQERRKQSRQKTARVTADVAAGSVAAAAAAQPEELQPEAAAVTMALQEDIPFAAFGQLVKGLALHDTTALLLEPLVAQQEGLPLPASMTAGMTAGVPAGPADVAPYDLTDVVANLMCGAAAQPMAAALPDSADSLNHPAPAPLGGGAGFGGTGTYVLHMDGGGACAADVPGTLELSFRAGSPFALAGMLPHVPGLPEPLLPGAPLSFLPDIAGFGDGSSGLGVSPPREAAHLSGVFSSPSSNATSACSGDSAGSGGGRCGATHGSINNWACSSPDAGPGLPGALGAAASPSFSALHLAGSNVLIGMPAGLTPPPRLPDRLTLAYSAACEDSCGGCTSDNTLTLPSGSFGTHHSLSLSSCGCCATTASPRSARQASPLLDWEDERSLSPSLFSQGSVTLGLPLHPPPQGSLGLPLSPRGTAAAGASGDSQFLLGWEGLIPTDSEGAVQEEPLIDAEFASMLDVLFSD